MKDKPAKYPQLRFKGFTDSWVQRKVSETAEVNPKTTLPDEFEYVDLGAVVGTSLNETRHEFKVSAPSRAQRLASVGDVFYQTVRPYQKNNYLFENAGITPFVFSTGYAQLRPQGDSYFLLTLLQGENFVSQVMDRSTGTSYPAINSSDLGNMHVDVPTEAEQVKIGSLFKSLDNLIAANQRKLDLLKEQKKGYLQKMFPKNGAKVPELRFAGFADDWEERKLGDTKTHFTDGNYGESYPSAKDMSDKENGVPFLRGSDFSNGYLDSSNANYIRPEKHAELTSGHIQQDDIILAVRGSLGTLGYATQENEGWNINSQLAILRTNKSEISGKFLIQYLLGSKGQKEILSRNTGTALKQLPIKQLKDIPVPVPTLEEQQKIGSFFKQLDNTIALHQRKLDLLKEQKKGFLQKMFV